MMIIVMLILSYLIGAFPGGLIIGKLFDNIERYYNSLYIKTCILKNKEKKMKDHR